VSLSQITTIGGLAGLIASVILLAWQTRSVAEQTKISNAIAGASVLEATTSDLREVLMLFVERPELRAYFYESKGLPTGVADRSRVIAVAEILGDALETGLVTNRLIPSTESFDDWAAYCQEMLRSGPTLAQLAWEHPEWWPELANIQDRFPEPNQTTDPPDSEAALGTLPPS
jgi:hypothetical protein